MNQHCIKIITAADASFGQHTGIMLFSLLESNKSISDKIEITILDGGILHTDKAKIFTMCIRYNSSVNFVPIDYNLLKSARIDGHISIATYFRIFIPKVLNQQTNKVLYLDSDIIVTGSIAELYNTDISEHYIAATLDPGSRNDGISYIRQLGLPGFEQYFNAGVLLINVNKWRRDNIFELLIARINTNPQLLKTWDQDALNAILWKNCKIIHPKYNVMYHFFNQELLKKLDSADYIDKINEAQKKPIIIHYNTFDKPWMPLCTHPLKNYYSYYLKISPWKHDYIRYKISFYKIIKSLLLKYLSPNQVHILRKIKNMHK